MTLREMLVGTLLQLDQKTDEATISQWRDKLTRFINDAIVDLTSELQPRRTDVLLLESGNLDLSKLPRPIIKAISLARGGTRIPYYYGANTDSLRVPATTDGEILVTYRYMPFPLKNDNDEPELPEWSHGAIIGYAVGRERSAGDANSVSAARACFELYNAAKRMMRAHRRELDSYAINGGDT